MNREEPRHALEPTDFHSMQEAQELTDTLERDLHRLGMGAANIRPEVVEVFSELVNNAAEHGAADEEEAHAHVRWMPHRRGYAFDMVVSDQGPGIRVTLERNPTLPPVENDAEAIGLAVQELVSGTGAPNRGIGLWMTVAGMRKPGRRLMIHSGQGLLPVLLRCAS